MKKVICLIFICFFISGCASTNYISFTNRKYAPKSQNIEILLTANDINRPYKELGIIEARSDWGSKYLKTALIKKARKIGADAIIKIQYGTDTGMGVGSGSGTGSFFTGVVVPMKTFVCKGVAIVFIDE